MNAQTRKEIRTILPFFAVTALAPLLTLPLMGLWPDDTTMAPTMFICTIAGVAMAAVIFGDEFSNRTMGLLLTQPLSRSWIWRRKMLVLGAALATCFLIFSGRVLLSLRSHDAQPALFVFVFGTLLFFAIGIYCTTPFWTMCVKNTLGSVAATFTTPMVLMLSTDLLMAWLFPRSRWDAESNVESYFMGAVLAFYFGLCYWLGRRMFLEFEVTDAQGREIALPNILQPVIAPLWRALTPGHGGPLRSLITKELYLQRVCFGLAIAYCVVFFLGAACWKLSPEWAQITATTTMITSSVLYSLLVSLVGGGMCVAEERNWNMLGWHLVLPPSRKKQWMVKVCVALASSLVLGILLPIGVFYFCKVLFHLPFDPLRSERMLVLIPYLLLTGIAIYASSLTTNTLRAVILTLVLASAGCGAISLAVMAGFQLSKMLEVFRTEVIHGTPVLLSILNPVFLLILLILLPVTLLAILLYLGYINFRAGEISFRRKWLQPFALWAGFTAILLIIAFMQAIIFFI